MQRRTIRALGTLAVAGLAFSLAACSNTPTGGGDSNTVTMVAPSDYRDAYTEVISDFEAANPGTTVNVTWGAGNDYEATENTQLAAGNAPDLLSVQPGLGGNLTSMGTLVKAGYLEDLSGQSWAGTIPDSLRSQTDSDGKTYIYPGILQPLGAFYNTQAVEEAGLTAPTTWSELLDFCSAAAADGKIAFSLGLSDQWVAQLIPYSLASTLVYGATPDWNAKLNAGEATFPDSEWLAVEQQYLDMNEAGCFSKDPNGISFDNTLPPVADGSALAIVQVGGVFSNLQSQNEDVVYELNPLPANDSGNTFMAGSPGVGIGVNAKAKNKDLALKFVEFLSQPESINKFATITGGSVPALSNDSFEVPALLENFNALVAEGKVNAFPDTGWPNAEVQNAHLVGIQNMFLGRATPAEVLQGMQDAVGK